MSKLSIYETGWLNLVFEGKNKEYGAYQLRQENPRTTFFAFILGLLCIAVFAIVMLVVSSDKAVAMPVPEGEIIRPVHINPPMPDEPKLPPPVRKADPPKTPDPAQPLSNPVIVAQNPDDPQPNNDPQPTPTESGSATGASTPIDNPGTPGPGTPNVNPPADNNPVILAAVDKMPEYPGGIQRFLAAIGNEFEKPDIDQTVTILMSFVVEKDGSISDIRVLRNPGYGLDKEAIRVLKAQKTKWKPGIKNGQPVRVLYSLPIKVTRS